MIQTRQLAQQMRRDAGAGDMLLTPNMEQRTVGIGRLTRNSPKISNAGPIMRASVTPAHFTRADHPFVGYGLPPPMEGYSEQGCDVISLV